jgi:hypothetical protein
MTTQQLITRVTEYLSYDLDGYFGTSPTNAEVVSALNDAMRDIALEAYLVEPSITLTLTAGNNTYSLRDTGIVNYKTLKVLRVVINNTPLTTFDGARRGLWTYQELEENYPGWRDADSSTPHVAVQLGTNLILYPPPSSTVVSAGENYIVGLKLPQDLSSATLSAAPSLPEELHEALAKVAAAKAADPNVTENHQDARVARLYQQGMGMAQKVGTDNRKMWSDPGTRRNTNKNFLYV